MTTGPVPLAVDADSLALAADALRNGAVVAVPTLLAWGESDRIIPFGQAKTWASLIPHATIRSFAGAGHLLLNERPDAVAAIGDFQS